MQTAWGCYKDKTTGFEQLGARSGQRECGERMRASCEAGSNMVETKLPRAANLFVLADTDTNQAMLPREKISVTVSQNLCEAGGTSQARVAQASLSSKRTR